MTRKDGATVSQDITASNAGTAVNQVTHVTVVREITRELTRRERLVLMLRYTEELTVHEIAAVLEIAVTEVERMLESITERVRRRLNPVYSRPTPRLA